MNGSQLFFRRNISTEPQRGTKKKVFGEESTIPMPLTIFLHNQKVMQRKLVAQGDYKRLETDPEQTAALMFNSTGDFTISTKQITKE